MRKQKVVFLITSLLISMFMFLTDSLPVTKATYVEGVITQDTVWTLIDSPFIVVNNITVPSGVTLTIEPGVEVRFGGNFSLNVAGRLIAQGTEDRMITFTSNRPAEEAKAGDWVAIEFIASSGSQMAYCTVEYAVNGIIIEDSSLEISNCEITKNSENGIKIIGNCSITIKNSKIMLNKNGVAPILLNINSSQQVTLDSNTISSNQYGVYINGTVENLHVVNCNLMSNDVGIYVSGKTDLDITHNSIAYNKIGVLYENSSSRVSINFNDLYGNTLAMRSNSSEPVNATYNYWGDSAGPYHPSLNPNGKGNPVESDGTDIDFIPFLSHPNRYENKPPTAWLISDKTTVTPNQEVLFVATNSSDDGRVDYYRLDFGDGETSGWTTLSVFRHKYSTSGTYTVKLTVLDDFGIKNTNTANVTINVQALPVLDVSLTLSTYTVGYLENVSVTIQVKSGGTPVESASVRLLSINGGTFNSNVGYTNATGYFTATFTTPNITQLTNVMLIATASKDGYADGADYKYVEVVPPLTVKVEVNPMTVESKENANVTVYVTHVEQPISGATIIISAELGNFSSETGVTDLNGQCKFIFTAPAVEEETNVTITAVASKYGYKYAMAQSVITVEPKNMTVEVEIYPKVIVSEENSSIVVYVTYDDELPIVGVEVNVSANLGSFLSKSETTDSQGICTFTYIAPVVYEETNVTITITLSEEGYRDVTIQSRVTVKPRILTVEVSVYPKIVISERTANISVHVTYNAQPIPDANVLVTASFGNFSDSALTDLNGTCEFVFVAPPVNQEINVTITVYASKIGYVESNSSVTITLKPGTLELEATINPTQAMSGETVTLFVDVRCNSTPVENVWVNVVSDVGNLSQYTNSSGLCMFTFTAPETTTKLTLTITITASKDGYIETQKILYLNVLPTVGPQGGGFPLTTLLIIMAVILAIIVIIALLIRFKIIEITWGEKET